jgi:alkylation response protein AidB-like acyl-CoA dehydrogenase
MPIDALLIDDATLLALADHAEMADAEPSWPAASWELLRGAGVLRWAIPKQYGGLGLDAVALLAGYERLASACLTTTFLLSQRDAAVRRLCDLGNDAVRRRWLPGLADGDHFLTVGLSQLTTSRQHQAPAMTAVPIAQGSQTIAYTLDGVIPWVSGAERADAVVIGATLADGRQLLATLPRGRTGVEIEPPLALGALLGSRTTSMHCRDARIEAEEVFAGPIEHVLSGSKGGGGLETSILALGLSEAAITLLRTEAASRAELRPIAYGFERLRDDLRRRVHPLASTPPPPAEAAAVRVAANRLVLSATQAALMAAKGTGFVRPHPAQRWARQALFFLVWSCPRPTAEGTMEHLLAAAGG